MYPHAVYASIAVLAVPASAREDVIGKDSFQLMFGTILTDNGIEFSCHNALESSLLPRNKASREADYCDVRASEQEAVCERNHVELRKLLLKRCRISFDDLVPADMAVLMSHLSSVPRATMGFMTSIRVLEEANGKAVDALANGLAKLSSRTHRSGMKERIRACRTRRDSQD